MCVDGYSGCVMRGCLVCVWMVHVSVQVGGCCWCDTKYVHAKIHSQMYSLQNIYTNTPSPHYSNTTHGVTK